jgi:hypothetical protein
MDLPPLPIIPLDVKLRDGSVISILADRFDTVFDLKERLSEQIGLYASQQRLIYAGKLLCDEMTLNFYKIPAGALLYFMPVVEPRTVGLQPYHLLTELLHLLGELPTADSRRFTDLIQDIRSILANPTLQSTARIDPHTQQLLLDAEETVSTAQRPTSRRTAAFRARVQDLTFDTYDTSLDGMRVLQSMLESDDDEPETVETTNTRYRKRLAHCPLPNPWVTKDRGKSSVLRTSALRLSCLPAGIADGHRHFVKSPTVKSRFSKQVAALKNMGFDDEIGILEALAETNGNVQLAAKLLQNQEPCK